MSSLPNYIEFNVTRDKTPQAGYIIQLTLYVRSKNNYGFIVGPTDMNGKASISKEKILKESEKELKLALMDFHPLENNYSGNLKAEIMNSEDIKRALKGYQIFGPENYETGYFEMLNQALVFSNKTDGLLLNVTQK